MQPDCVNLWYFKLIELTDLLLSGCEDIENRKLKSFTCWRWRQLETADTEVPNILLLISNYKKKFQNWEYFDRNYHNMVTQICPSSKSKFNLYEAWSLTASTLLHQLVLSIELGTVQTGTGKVDPARSPIYNVTLERVVWSSMNSKITYAFLA